MKTYSASLTLLLLMAEVFSTECHANEIISTQTNSEGKIEAVQENSTNNSSIYINQDNASEKARINIRQDTVQNSSIRAFQLNSTGNSLSQMNLSQDNAIDSKIDISQDGTGNTISVEQQDTTGVQTIRANLSL